MNASSVAWASRPCPITFDTGETPVPQVRLLADRFPVRTAERDEQHRLVATDVRRPVPGVLQHRNGVPRAHLRLTTAADCMFYPAADDGQDFRAVGMIMPRIA